MVQQYLRSYSLDVFSTPGAVINLSQLRFKFRVSRGNIQTPNTADIIVYNLAEDTMNSILKEFTSIILQAGYEGNMGVIFQGTIKQIRKGRESATDTYLAITATDGDEAYNYAFVQVPLKAGTTPEQQVASVAAAMNLPLGSVSGLPTNGLPRGKVLFGLGRDIMRDIGYTCQADWSIQNGQLQIVPQNSYIQRPPIVLNSESGLIGIPEQTQDGIKVRALLNPQILIGGAIQINNRTIIAGFRYPTGTLSSAENTAIAQTIHTSADGLYKVYWVDYVGDTRGQEWYSEITCLAIDAAGAALLGISTKSQAVAPVGPIGITVGGQPTAVNPWSPQ